MSSKTLIKRNHSRVQWPLRAVGKNGKDSRLDIWNQSARYRKKVRNYNSP